jgi:hypothetical protein
MQSETHQTVQNNEPIIAVPTHADPNLPSQLYAGNATELILAVAVLIRAVALLIQVTNQQKIRK